LRKLAALLCALALVLASLPAVAQYDEELSQYSASLRVLMIQAERLRPQDSASRAAIQSELFELSKKLHRLEEEALRANTELQRRGNAPDRKLLLAAAISKSLDLAQSLIGFYLDTHDKAFWVSASQAAQSARQLLAQR